MSIIFNFKGIGSVKKKNIKTIYVYISESFLRTIKRTPTLSQMFTKSQLDSLKAERKNTINVNHYIYSRLKNLENEDDFVIIEQ
jgi:hypothetical protein